MQMKASPVLQLHLCVLVLQPFVSRFQRLIYLTVKVTYTVSNGATLHTTMHATATELTPLMLAQHLYW